MGICKQVSKSLKWTLSPCFKTGFAIRKKKKNTEKKRYKRIYFVYQTPHLLSDTAAIVCSIFTADTDTC